MNAFEKKKLKYQTKDSAEKIFGQIRSKTNDYFSANNFTKNANDTLWLKFYFLLATVILAYFLVLSSTTGLQLFGSFLLFGGLFLILGINIGHDAAHGCLTGIKKKDNTVFELIFGLQGLNGYMWQIRHNQSHHIFPNIYENDVDMDLSGLILLESNQKARWYHQFQHFYAPFVYMFASLAWVFVQDFYFLLKKEQANLMIKKIPTVEWVKFWIYKTTYLILFLVLPYLCHSFPFLTVFVAFIFMHFCLSLFISFTFFISHHVSEVDYFEANHSTETIETSWCQHQMITTIDFSPESKFANFIFGGFNLHIAHHIFPDVSHIHYPAITKIIKETLTENKADWYKSFSFFQGVRSHLTHLKASAQRIIHQQSENSDLEAEIEIAHVNSL